MQCDAILTWIENSVLRCFLSCGKGRRQIVSGCVALVPFLSQTEALADFEKMEGLKDKDYGKPRMK